MTKRRIIVGIPLVLILAVFGYWGYLTYLAPQPLPPTPGPEADTGESRPSLVSAEGRVVPVQFARLSFNTGGLVEKVLVLKGEAVASGEAIARLDGHSRLAAGLAAAELEQLSAQQALDALYEDAGLRAAQALQSMADARDAVRDAERRLNNLNSASPQVDIDQARANKVLAEEQLERAREAFEPYAGKPEDNLTRAVLQSKLSQAQKEYDDAVRLLNNLLGTTNAIDLEQAEADLALAQARLAVAQRDYEDLKDGPDPDEVELTKARLANAAAQVAAARDAMQDLELRAPFAGMLVASDLKVGEFVSPGVPVATLADLSAWQVQTIDLAESDVALLSPGMTAQVTLDAFPGERLTGVIREIDLQGADRRGDITYTVTLDFDPGDVPVRWEMTAFVDISLP